MPSTVRAKPRRSRPQRYRFGSQRGPASAGNTFRNAAVAAVTDSSDDSGGDTIDVQLDQVVSLKGIPGWAVSASAVAKPITAAALVNPTTVRLTFAGAVAAFDLLVVPENEPTVRTTTGGWVNAGSTTLDFGP